MGNFVLLIEFTVPGEPQGKGRPRIGKVGTHARMFTPAKTVAFEGLVAHAAQQVMAGSALLEGPCRVELDILCSVPASWSKKKHSQALDGILRPTKKPDADNVLKAVCDGINGVVWKDDVQVVDVTLRKMYAATPCLRVKVAPLDTAKEQSLVRHDSAVKLARNTLWLAYCWNDHNFQKRPEQYAKDVAKECGIDSLEAANDWLDKN